MKSLLTLRGWFVLCTLAVLVTLSSHAQTGVWTWRGGSIYAGDNGNANYPGSRLGAANWTDQSGNLWVFAGTASDFFNPDNDDLWKFSPTTNTWTLISSQAPGSVSIYGRQGVPSSPSNPSYPGARDGASFTTDSNGNFWLFGGGNESNGTYLGTGSDLWEYNPNTNQWTFWGGSTNIITSPVFTTVGSGSTSDLPWPTTDGMMWVDPNFNVWIFGGEIESTYIAGSTNAVWEFTPSTLVWTWQSGSMTDTDLPPYYGIINPYQDPGSTAMGTAWADGSGNLWLFGGADSRHGYESDYDVSNELWSYSTTTNTWTIHNLGQFTDGVGVYGIEGVNAPSNIPGGRWSQASTMDQSGNLWIMAGEGYNTNPALGYLNDLLELDGRNSEWSWQGGSDNTTSVNSVYGAQNISSYSNSPGSRNFSALSADVYGNIWLFSGQGLDSTGYWGELNDLWEFSPNGMAATPLITPASQTILVAANVSITDATPGSTIYYTTDGTTPITSPTTMTYTGPFSVTNTETVNAIAVANENGYGTSATASTTYTMGNVFWAPATTTFTYGTALGAVPGLLDATSPVGYNIAYSVHNVPVNSSTVLNVGQYQLDATFTTTGNVYVEKISYKITVTPAPLTVTPNPVTVMYGSAVPKYTYSITGFVNNDPSTVVTGSPTVYSNATSHATAGGPVVYTSNVGNYTIYTTTGSLKAANYSFVFLTAPLTINQCTCSLTVTPYSVGITLGSPIPTSFGYKVTGFVNFDNAANQLTGTAATWTNATSTSGHGYYTIFSGPGSLQQIYNNYAGINYGTATLTIH